MARVCAVSTATAETRTYDRVVTIGRLEGTLTRQYQIDDLLESISRIRPGQRVDEAQAELDAPGHNAHIGLASRLLSHDHRGVIKDSELLRSCGASRRDAHVLVFVGLLIADWRLADLAETFLTGPDGRVDERAFHADSLRQEIGRRGYGSAAQKAASNVLRYFETGGLVAPTRYGSTIVGVDHVYSAAHAVPGVVAFVRERALDLEGVAVDPGEAVEFAIDRGVSRWLLMTADDFRLAADAQPVAAGTTQQPVERDVTGESFRDWDEFKPKDEGDYVAEVTHRTIIKSRTHEAVLNRYAAWAQSQGFSTSSPHPVDLRLRRTTDVWLVEAKVLYRGNATNAVRGAIGQLLAYRHFLYPADDPALVALFTESVGDAYVGLLDSLDIRAVWPCGSGWCGSTAAIDEGLAEG